MTTGDALDPRTLAARALGVEPYGVDSHGRTSSDQRTPTAPIARGASRRRLPSGETMLLAALSRNTFSCDIAGRLTIEMPSGHIEVFGGHRPGPDAAVVMRSLSPVWSCLTRGSLGIAEAHIDGRLDTPDLREVLRFCLANRGAYAALGTGNAATRLAGRMWHRARANTPAGSRRNIAAHYDLGNAFYELWLDRSMMYSSAIFDGAADETLEEAQLVRLQRIVQALELSAGQRVLEIGCGWGGLAEKLARCGATVDAITISAEQLAFTHERLMRAGLDGSATARFCDYRNVDGCYDRVVSVEMVEAVGEANWPVYFRTLRDRLAPGGVGLLQAITIEDAHFEAYRRDPDFIQRYIFPGGMLPTVSRMAEEAAKTGLSFEPVSRFGRGYARTLAHWRDAFDAAWPRIAELGFDDRFRRMWRYYLTYCEVGFEAGDIDVGFYRLRKPV